MSQHKFLSQQQKEKLAELLDKRFNLPLIKGSFERKAWVKFVDAVDNIIASKIQNEYLAALNDPNFQVEELFISALQDNLSPLISSMLSVPILPGFLKIKMIDYLIEILLKALAEATTLDEVIEEFMSS